MFSHQVREMVKSQTRKNLAFIDSDDDMFEILFKYFESLKGHIRNLKELESRMEKHDTEMDLMEKVLLTP